MKEREDNETSKHDMPAPKTAKVFEEKKSAAEIVKPNVKAGLQQPV